MILRPTGTLNLAVTRDMQVDNTNNLYILCQTNVGAVTINLPRISSIAGVPNSTWGFRIFITDEKNNASVKNITIVPNPADKINGSSSPIVLKTNGATGHLLISGFKQWEFNLGASSSGASGTLLFNSFPEISVDSFDASEKSIRPIVGIGSHIIPANFLTVGKKLSIKIGGVIGFNNQPENVVYGDNPFLIYFGSDPVLQLNLVSTLNGFVGNENPFFIEVEMTMQNGGLLVSAGSITIRGATEPLLSFTPLSLNPAIPQPIDVRIAFGGGNEGNGTNVRTTLMSIESPTLFQ